MLLNIRKFDFGGPERQRRDGLKKKKRDSDTIFVVVIIEPPPHWIKSHAPISVEPPTDSTKLVFAVNL